MEIGLPQKTITITPLEEPLGRPKEVPAPVAPALEPEREKVPA